MRGDDSIAELCREESIAQSLYDVWSKEFMEAGKRRVAGDTEWAAIINADWRKSIESIIQTGRDLAAAKEELGHGEFLKLIQDDLPFSANTAQSLMRVAADIRITNTSSSKYLPPSWKVLSALTTLSDADFKSGIESGIIRADTALRAADAYQGAVKIPVAETWGAKRKPSTLPSAKDAREIGPRTIGLLQGTREGLKAFRHTLSTGDVPDFVTKVESARQEAIGGNVGKVLRVPTRLLSAEDEFFKATARRMELSGLAVRKARSEGLKGDALKERIAELTANPTDAMVDRSLDYARYLTFQRPLGPAMRNIQSIAQQHPWLKLFVPFIRTPTNLLKFAVERSPAAPLLREVRKDFAAGGASRDLAAARMALGTGLGLLVSQWTADGHVTGGGPADENAKRLLRAGGWQPYSIKVGDRYYSYRRLDPLATTIGVVADMIDLQGVMTQRQQQEVVPLVISSLLQNLENKTWLSGMLDVMGVIDDPQRNAHYFVERLAGSIAVPALAAQTARTIDPVARETSSEGYAKGMLDAIRARIPGQSQGLLPKRDVWGEEIRNEGGIGPDLASPIWTKTDKHDPVAKEVLDAGATIGPLSRSVGGARLPDDLFNQYQAIAGQLTRQYVESEIRAPEWMSLRADQRRKAIAKAKDDARKDARDALMESQAP